MSSFPHFTSIACSSSSSSNPSTDALSRETPKERHHTTQISLGSVLKCPRTFYPQTHLPQQSLQKQQQARGVLRFYSTHRNNWRQQHNMHKKVKNHNFYYPLAPFPGTPPWCIMVSQSCCSAATVQADVEGGYSKRCICRSYTPLPTAARTRSASCGNVLIAHMQKLVPERRLPFRAPSHTCWVSGKRDENWKIAYITQPGAKGQIWAWRGAQFSIVRWCISPSAHHRRQFELIVLIMWKPVTVCVLKKERVKKQSSCHKRCPPKNINSQ